MEEYKRLKDSYILTPEKLKSAKEDMCILHPLPRVNEISVAVDKDPKACYFKQALNGKYMRMALILKLLEDAACSPVRKTRDMQTVKNLRCQNPRCITSAEQELEHIFKRTDEGICRCIYCEKKAE